MAVKDFPFVHHTSSFTSSSLANICQQTVYFLLWYVKQNCIEIFFFPLVLKVVDSFHIAGGVTNGINIRIQRSEAHVLNEG